MNIVYLLAAYGLAFGFQNKATFLRKVPLFSSLLKCIYCLGFHCGYLIFFARWGIAGGPRHVSVLVEALLWAFASSVFCYVVDTFSQWLERGNRD